MGAWRALAVTSGLFGLLHPITPAYIVMAGLLGAYLGAVWIVTGNLLTVIVAHALYDFLALRILLHRPEIAGPESGPEIHP
jgi:membrane protease YdiL (CAAX protease family)